jgi:hypothetical protein
MSLAALVFVALAQLPASPDPKPVPVTGIVVDGSGQPCAFADVWLSEAIGPDEGRRFGMELWWARDIRSDEGSTPFSDHISADAAGRFTFRIPADAIARRSPVPLVVWAGVAGKGVLGWRRLPRIVLAGDPPVRIVLGAPARTELTILSPDRKPVAGARVTPVRAVDLPIRKRLTDDRRPGSSRHRRLDARPARGRPRRGGRVRDAGHPGPASRIGDSRIRDS